MNKSKTEIQKERHGEKTKRKRENVQKYNSLRKDGRKDNRRLEGGNKDGRICGWMVERMNEGGMKYKKKN
jgi:hypothetical protein